MTELSIVVKRSCVINLMVPVTDITCNIELDEINGYSGLNNPYTSSSNKSRFFLHTIRAYMVATPSVTKLHIK